MATRSILKTVLIKDTRSAGRLASALESAKGHKSREVTMSRMVSDASREEIRAMFHVVEDENDGD